MCFNMAASPEGPYSIAYAVTGCATGFTLEVNEPSDDCLAIPLGDDTLPT